MWIWITLAVVGTAAVTLFFVCLTGANTRARGGMVDLTGYQPGGELDLDWDDPRPHGVLTLPADTTAAEAARLRETLRVGGNRARIQIADGDHSPPASPFPFGGV